ncbi:MAG: DUF1289 domain-containing protein [Parasphingorhabdus sp.]|uniref:DUF1289 domain-containing protein n=1 Tax=Parasphingorhabdus sp. TaxID=2709688 RepID=UPI003296BF80
MDSPCNNICMIDPPTGYCEGCGRNLDEIGEWASANGERKREILSILPQRLKLLNERKRQ